MKKNIYLFVVLFIIMICSCLKALSNDIEIANFLIESLTSKNKVDNWPKLGPLTQWTISIDTFTNEVQSQTIKKLYNKTCIKLQELYPNEIVTYSWNEDILGYPRQATIVQFKNEFKGDSYLMVYVSENNDNDGFVFSYKKGEFDTKDKKKLEDWKIEKGVLHCNHNLVREAKHLKNR